MSCRGHRGEPEDGRKTLSAGHSYATSWRERGKYTIKEHSVGPRWRTDALDTSHVLCSTWSCGERIPEEGVSRKTLCTRLSNSLDVMSLHA
jgi:hypothetical protein